MPQITLLSQETIDKIAAGEVVERPSSVVKELVENAIDAKATAITVEIKEGGISFIRITDNGCGIARKEVPLAFLRHSTSKIKSVEDLISVTSLGFRGEALSSISAVSQVELITKTGTDLTGTRYVIEGSKEKENEEIGAPDGTTFIVRNLFYNTPARRKFLKSAQTEGNYISDLMERLALSHPDIAFKFINNNQTKMHTSGNSNELDIIYHIYGRDITAALLPLKAETEWFTVKGFVGKPLISRGNRNYENYFINGRYIKSSLLAKSIEEAYKGFMMQHQYPFCVLYLSMNTDLLDVNVHPTKMELRFSNNEEIYQLLYQLVRNALTHKDFIPDVPVTETQEKKRPPVFDSIPEPFEKRRIQQIRDAVGKDSPYELKYPRQQEVQKKASSFFPSEKVFETVQEKALEAIPNKSAEALQDRAAGALQGGAAEAVQARTAAPCKGIASENEIPALPFGMIKEEISYQVNPVYEQQDLTSVSGSFLSRDAKKKHKIIGQLFATYWMVEYEDKLFIIDQHAAHEKVLYERTIKRVRENAFTSQMISPPVILTLNLEEAAMLEKYKEQISVFGYAFEHFGGKEYAIHAVPADFTGIDMKGMFVELLGDFTNLNGRDAPNLIMEKVASMSCKAAVKGNQHISRAEMEQLIDELMGLDNPYHCPHGRPTIISMSKYEIEKKFKRIV